MTDLPAHPLRLSDLPNRKATHFDLTPTETERAAMADVLGILRIKQFRFTGTLAPLGRSDWVLRAELGASVEQSCVITLAPVATRIDEKITRQYLANWAAPDGDEVQMPDDTDSDPLPVVLDLYAVAIEALALAQPAFPRAQGAALGAVQHAAEGVRPMTDEDVKPFAGLAALKDKLTGDT